MRRVAIAAAALLALTLADVAEAQQACPRYSACLSWTPPTQNTDGTALTNLAGYRIHYGRSPSQLTQTVQVANPAATAYRLSGLATGSWYFAVRAYTTAGAESAPSNVGSKVVRHAGPTDGSIVYQ
jgi:hypothetical protein